MVPRPAVVFTARDLGAVSAVGGPRHEHGAVVKITDVEAIVLRQPVVDEGIADGSQDDLIIRVHTDAGLTGIGEVDSSPELVASLVRARGSHAVASGLRDILVGEDPLDVERLWDRMYRGLIYFGRRGIAIHAISGIDIALWDLKGKALGVPVSSLIGTPVRDRVRAYASRLMPETTAEVGAAVRALREAGFTAVKFGWGPLGRDADARHRTGRSRRGGRRSGFRGDDRRGPRVCGRRRRCDRGSHGRMRSSGSAGSRSRSSPTNTRRTRRSPKRRPADRRRRAGLDAMGLPGADRARSG